MDEFLSYKDFSPAFRDAMLKQAQDENIAKVQSMGEYFGVELRPVRHGEWRYMSGPDSNDNYWWECSLCGCTDVHCKGVDVPYCWHCGARMDEEREAKRREVDN